MPTEEARPLISVCVVTGGRLDLLRACLRSLREQRTPPPFEVLICCNGEAGLAPTIQEGFPGALVVEVSPIFPGVARNLLVQRARGDLLLFVDDDAILVEGMLHRLADAAASHPEASVFGGPNLTPPGSSSFQTLQGAVLGSVVTTGPVRRRYEVGSPAEAGEQDLILCNLAVRREAMLPFAEDLRAGEESALLVQMSRAGIRMRYDPTLVVFHERRSTLGGYARQMIKYGEGRGLVLMRRPWAVRPGYLAPLALIGYLVLLPPLALASHWWLAPLGLYGLLVAAAAVQVARRLDRWSGALPAAGLIISTHLLYGLGVLSGIVSRRRVRARAQARWVAGHPGQTDSPPTGG